MSKKVYHIHSKESEDIELGKVVVIILALIVVYRLHLWILIFLYALYLLSRPFVDDI